MASESPAAKFDAFINEKYIPLDKKIKIALAVVLAVLPIVIFYFLFFAPKQEEIGTLKKKKGELEVEVNKGREAEKHLEENKAELAKAEKEFEEISALLPKDKEIPALLRTISDLGKSAGLDFVSFKPGNETLKDFYAEFPIDISILGPYHNIGLFLDKVSKMERIVTVDNIKMGPSKEEDGGMLLNASCKLLTYRFTGQKVEGQQGAAQGAPPK